VRDFRFSHKTFTRISFAIVSFSEDTLEELAAIIDLYLSASRVQTSVPEYAIAIL
jgi:hypothetical protein